MWNADGFHILYTLYLPLLFLSDALFIVSQCISFAHLQSGAMLFYQTYSMIIVINGYYLILQHNSTTPCIFQKLIHAHNTCIQQLEIG